MNKPIAVLISDIHYSLQTLELADKAMRMAIQRANELQIPLIVAGDLHDTKANMRAECVNAIIETFKLLKVNSYVLIGNHDRINEKNPTHSLNFLEKYTNLVTDFRYKQHIVGVHLVAYHHSPEELRKHFKDIRVGTLIMHQGIQGSNSGEYIQDHSAITKDDVAGFRVISGHYHQRQDITLPNGGLWSYIGNPYSLNFGEANDPEKGFQILNDDGTLTFVPTNLRKHIIFEITAKEVSGTVFVNNPDDLVWVKVRGTKEELSKIKKLPTGVRLDLIPTDIAERYNPKVENLPQNEILDNLIDSSNNLTDDKKDTIKKLWKDLK